MNNKIPSIEDMIEKSEIPNYFVLFIDKLKKLFFSNDFKNIIKNYFETDINNIYEMIKIVPQGSYDRKTDSYHFKKIEKSDIDLILLISPNLYKLDLTILRKNEINYNFANKYIDEIKNNIFLYNYHKKDKMDNFIYKKLHQIQKFKKNIIKFLHENFKNIEIENAKNTIKIKNGSLNIDLAIGCNFEIDLKLHSNSDFLNKWKNDMKIISHVNRQNSYFTILGINIFSFDGLKQSTPHLNKINVKRKNDKTKQMFSDYVVFFKNLIKFIKQKNINLNISSFEIECILYSMDDYWFYQSLENNNKESKKYILNIVKRFVENKYNHYISKKEFENKFIETNEIVKLCNTISYEKIMHNMTIIYDVLKYNGF